MGDVPADGLPTDVYVGQPEHAGITNNANEQINALTAAWNGRRTDPGLLASFVHLFPAPAGGNDYAAMQAALDTLAATGGGVLLLQRGTYKIGTPLTVPSNVILRGQGRNATILQTMGSLGGDYVLIRLGHYDADAEGGPAWTPVHGCRLDNVAVDAGSKELCVEAQNLQEMSGLGNVVLTGFALYGAQVSGSSANFDLTRVEAYPQAGGAQRGIYVTGASGCTLSRITCGVSGDLDTGIHLHQSTATVGPLAHFERCDDGLLWDESTGVGIGVSGPTGGATVTNLVRMTDASRYVAMVNTTKGGATHTIVDEFFSKTFDDAYIPIAGMGDVDVARLAHYGDKAGFYGTAPIVKPTGVAVTAAGIHAALVSLGLIGA